MQFLPKLKTILQSKLFYIFLFVLLSIYVLFTTIIIKYESKLDEPTEIEGYVIDLTKKDEYISFILKGEEKVQCIYYLNEEDIDPNILGKYVKLTGKVKELTHNTIPNTFDYKDYLYQNKIYLSFTASDIKVIKDENIFYKIKNKIIKHIDSYDKSIKTYLNLFILGDKSYLDSNTSNAYKTNGIWHLFAISGMHISFIILVLDKILKNIKFKKTIISSILFYFMFITSFAASVMRSVIFYFLKNILDYWDISLDNKRVLFLTAFIILLINPFMLYNTGFQYSFLITLSIMLMSNKITGSYLKQIFKISLISFVVSMPITINMNYEINLLSIFLNVFYVPLISVVIFPLSILVFILPFLSFLLNIFISLLEISTNIFYNLKLSVIIPKMSTILIILYYLFLYLYYKYKNSKLFYLVFIVFSLNYIYPELDSNYYVYYLDVGQGDSALLISPHKTKVIMIDTGGIANSDYHVSNNVITFLKSLGISKINLLIVSHGDADHAKEALNYLENYHIDNIILNKNTYNNLEKEISKKGHVVSSYQSKYFNFQNINNYLSDDENYSSIITYLSIFNYKFLFMGDAPKEIEEKLIEDYNIKANFLKIGHHGSDTSTSSNFIRVVSPDISVISVGKNNRYGHPKESVLETLAGYQVYRTDESGTIEVKIKQNRYTIKTYMP